MNDKPILIIHPEDFTTNFLNGIKNDLKKSFIGMTHHFNIKRNDKSHIDCLNRITNHSDNGIIIFLGHGRSDSLFGAKGRKFASIVSRDLELENPDDYYFKTNFIDESNIDIFKNKKVFCLSCNSNGKISKTAIEKGAKTFLGFGFIPTSSEEFKQEGFKNVSIELVEKIKNELNYIIRTSIKYSISQEYSFYQLQNLIEFITNQRISDILVNQKKFKDRYILTDYLYLLKKEIVVLGDKNLKLIEK